jgi:acyl dehydratase
VGDDVGDDGNGGAASPSSATAGNTTPTPDHHAADAAKRDRVRAHGWTVLAFWGGQIVRHADADACARQVIAALR